ncbi:peptidase M28 [Marinicauda pacifica]|uniref:Carboxypeptidase Q n=1 Tax=Marinicauda pacifica TaxID=1133559 RepID=A0A4S2HEM7_9PROT|nr:M20/M25/M40 family metallo-hydrolase [Marinicauda pacifica]TGY94072.1 peptidase M28 family protein [Marinicauda pacifica]GGE32617.1 peptidase M28 [Marinicauda pacifica]
MLRTLVAAGVIGLAGATVHAQDERYELSDDVAGTARQLAETALESDLAYEIVESLTTEVGPRLAGTPQEARAREWGVETLRELGFENVRVEEFALDLWTRGETIYEDVAIVSPYPQPVYATSLGGAGSTPEAGLEAEIVFFDSYDDLLTFDDASDALEGKLVYVNDRMVASRTGEGYGWANRKRRSGWVEAENRGAVGVIVRSVGTSSHRFAHTGMMGFPDERMPEIPVVAVSAPDADQIERIHESGEPIVMSLNTNAGWRGEVVSGNVIGEIPGREAPEEIVVIGGHLDSWDLGTGALDDGAGVAITMAAAKLIGDLDQHPRRTIRVVLFGAEEVGLVGARAYAAAREEDGTLDNHVIGSESDFGAREIWRFDSNVGEHALPVMDAMARELAFLGILRGDNEGGGGPDMIPLQYAGVPMARLAQNGEDYFNYHHTPDDTLDKIDEDELAQNVAAWAMFTYMAAELPVDFRPQDDEGTSEDEAN